MSTLVRILTSHMGSHHGGDVALDSTLDLDTFEVGPWTEVDLEIDLDLPINLSLSEVSLDAWIQTLYNVAANRRSLPEIL